MVLQLQGRDGKRSGMETIFSLSRGSNANRQNQETYGNQAEQPPHESLVRHANPFQTEQNQLDT